MRIGLMGPFGYGNLGDAATQDAIIQRLRSRFPEAELLGYSLVPEDTSARHGIRSFAISRESWHEQSSSPLAKRLAEVAHWIGWLDRPALRSLERWLLRVPVESRLIGNVYRSLQGVKLLVISGGGQIEDYWGGGGPWSYPYTLLKWCIVARALGAKIAVVSVGAGPIDHPLSKVFLSWALKLADYRSYRDSFSQHLVQSIGVTTDDGIFPDLAFSLELSKALGESAASSGGRVAVGPIGYFRPQFWPREDNQVYETYKLKLLAFVRFLVARGYTVFFVPGEAHYDRLVIDELVAELSLEPAVVEHVSSPRIESVQDLLQVLSQVDFVVASRFHNLVLAHMLGKPTIALSYQEKIDSLMRAAGLKAYCFQVGAINEALLQARMLELEANAPALKALLADRCATYAAQLSTQYERIFALATQ